MADFFFQILIIFNKKDLPGFCLGLTLALDYPIELVLDPKSPALEHTVETAFEHLIKAAPQLSQGIALDQIKQALVLNTHVLAADAAHLACHQTIQFTFILVIYSIKRHLNQHGLQHGQNS